jgi:chromosome segregation ATPase
MVENSADELAQDVVPVVGSRLSGDVNAGADISEGVAPKQYSTADMEQMLRNFRLRKRLGLLPQATRKVGHQELRWIRQSWRPPQLLEERLVDVQSEETPAESRSRQIAELSRDVERLQQRLDHGFRELNAERRNEVSLSEALRRQGDSLNAISAEAAKVQEQLLEVRSDVRTRTAENGRLAVRLQLQRQSQAKANTQAAVLASAVEQLSVVPDDDEATLRDLATCRAQISALVEENELLLRRLSSAVSPGATSSPAVAGLAA